MSVTEALTARHSVRAYRPQPVPEKTIMEIMEAALKAPSWANTQPWEVFVATGDALERVRAAYVGGFEQETPRSADIPRPEQWPPANLQRMEELREQRLKQLEQHGQGPAREDIARLNHEFFRAPAVIYLCMDRSLTQWSIFDIGMLAQSIMLAATERGLGTVPAYNLVVYPGILRQELDIPEEMAVIIGIAIGYEDEDHPQNRFRSNRRPAEEVVRLRGD